MFEDLGLRVSGFGFQSSSRKASPPLGISFGFATLLSFPSLCNLRPSSNHLHTAV